MAVDESRRRLLHDAARKAWGAEAALVLMEMLPSTGWADVATKRDLGHLEERMDLRFDAVRSDMASMRWELRAEMEHLQRRAIQWNVGTLLAAVAAVTALVTLG